MRNIFEIEEDKLLTSLKSWKNFTQHLEKKIGSTSKNPLAVTQIHPYEPMSNDSMRISSESVERKLRVGSHHLGRMRQLNPIFRYCHGILILCFN